MPVEYELLPFLDWLLPSMQPLRAGFLGSLLGAVVLLSLLGCLFGYLVAAIQFGPGEGFYRTAKVVFSGAADLALLSPRRTWAMTRLSFKESIRNKTLVVFPILMGILLLGGWYLDVKSDNPGPLYIGTVMGSTSLLVMVLAVFLSTFSLPLDIQNKTIYTVMTKPVRAGEVVLGRILGFSGVATLVIAVTCPVSYLFVVRGLAHRHEVLADSVVAEPGGGVSGRTTLDGHHRHAFELDAEGNGWTDTVAGHRHRVTRNAAGGYDIGPPVDALQARVPRYGRLTFLDRSGKESAKGISVGYEWTYRSYIEGGTLAAGVWRFEGINERRFPNNGLPLEATISVFRTHKGNIEAGVRGQWILQHPEKNIRSTPFIFESQEFVTQKFFIPRELDGARDDGAVEKLDLFRDLVSDDGRLEIVLQCIEPAQYFGMATHDLYLREAEQLFVLNFFKGFFTIWLQMIMVICIGVMLSTFLSWPIAMLGTAGAIVLGYNHDFIRQVFLGIVGQETEAPGGGPLESLIRLVLGMNLMTELGFGWGDNVIKSIDFAGLWLLNGLVALLPDFARLQTSEFVARGYDIPFNLVAQQTITTGVYLVMVSVIGYFLFKSREVGA